MPLKSFILFFFLVSIWVPAFSQTRPVKPNDLSLGERLYRVKPSNILESFFGKDGLKCEKVFIAERKIDKATLN